MSKQDKQERGALVMTIIALAIIGLIAGPCCCFFGGGAIGTLDSFRDGSYSNPMRNGQQHQGPQKNKLRDPRFDRAHDKASKP